MTDETRKTWPRRPIIYEINTWVWLNTLSERYNCQIDWATFPRKNGTGFPGRASTGIWLMGVWERSPTGRAISLSTPAIVRGMPNNVTRFFPAGRERFSLLYSWLRGG